ncbi:hypothetical protein MMC09_000436 [Bachmanniomyces sp. S44760]|nr:hypothetical protein [Bachmanniomyces sp. S44760]
MEQEITTSLVVENLHCSSCVNHVQEIFRDYNESIGDVDISILTHEVRVVHRSSLSSMDICRLLVEAAFDVHSLVSVDQTGSVILEFNPDSHHDDWLEVASELWRHSQTPPARSRLRRSGSSRFDASRGTKKKRHLERCEACRSEQLSSEKAVELDSYSNGSSQVERRSIGEKGRASVAPHIPQSARASGDKSPAEIDSTPHQAPQSAPIIVDVPKRYELLLSIAGMTCASCSNAIQNALQTLDIVESVHVELMTNSASVIFTGDEARVKMIVDATEDLGYEVGVMNLQYLNYSYRGSQVTPKNADTSYKAVLSIGGMTCASCTSAVTDGLHQLPFVQKVDVTLMTNSATVIYQNRENLDTIVEKVEDLGYDCTIGKSSPVDSAQRQDSQSTAVGKRTIKIKVNGMFCGHCPPRVMEALEAEYSSAIAIDGPPSLDNPVISITYTPKAPNFTIRDIISSIDSIDDAFTASVYHPPSLEERSRDLQIHERQRILRRLVLSLVVAIPTLLIGVVWMSLVPESNSIRKFFDKSVWSGSVSRADWALFILATPVMFLAADVFHVRALKEIRALWRKGSRTPILRRFYRFGSMNLLISAGTSVAYFSSLALLIIGATANSKSPNVTTYFDSVIFLTFFILIGRYLEAYSKSRAGDAVAMLGYLKPEKAMLIETSGADSDMQGDKPGIRFDTREISADLLEIGDLVVIPRGSSPPADGIVVKGLTKFDESSLTGESRGVSKEMGDKVLTGSVNIGDPITIEVTETGGTSMLDQIVAVVREGQTKRAPVERIADIITGYFVPVITALAILTFFIWFAIGESGVLSPRYLNGQQGGWAFWSLEFAIAVFVVACPCGIGLAAPTALFVGGGIAAKHGILVRGGGEAFQEASDLDAVVFDKTGTLTEGGDLKVTEHEMISTAEDSKVIWSIVKALEEQSTHPIARAILSLASCQPLTTNLEIISISEESGKGVRGTFTSSEDGQKTTWEAALGSEAMIASLVSEPNYYASQILSTWQSQCKSTAVFALRRLPSNPWRTTTLFALTDPLRPSALPAIKAIQARGLETYMLTGDNSQTAHSVASELGIPIANVFAGVLPVQKAEKIEWFKAHCPRRERRYIPSWLSHVLPSSLIRRKSKTTIPQAAKIAYIGDGTNDAPALLASSVSISLSTASPIAYTSSSFILLHPSLLLLPTLLNLSTRVFKRVRFNFGWALIYNIVLVPIAAGILFEVGGGGWRLGPVWGSAAMAASSVSVVSASLALRLEPGWWMFWKAEKGGKGSAEANERSG